MRKIYTQYIKQFITFHRPSKRIKIEYGIFNLDFAFFN
ncbi:hypothetical protein HFN_0989 [Helicobacter fennelliae MRY12-0050]|uniref:Uncharacterized protein n=1 Tax=Helicobacter fennelliae MRY12-0050 TaxID=1325130 RepID=T1CSH6_9HELI|nr:hypothetical protein HFN_0989 [Helicobacter fennelliae MRY12-0050]